MVSIDLQNMPGRRRHHADKRQISRGSFGNGGCVLERPGQPGASRLERRMGIHSLVETNVAVTVPVPVPVRVRLPLVGLLSLGSYASAATSSM